jgi:hypothetical protein
LTSAPMADALAPNSALVVSITDAIAAKSSPACDALPSIREGYLTVTESA